MTSQQLPERAHLEQLKNQAKSLLRAAQANDPAALHRFHALPALAGKPLSQAGSTNLALHDAQSVIAREYGFKSWKELHEHVEEQSLSFAAAVDEFVRCATGGAQARALRLLARFSAIAHANLYCELVLADAEAVDSRMQQNPESALQPGGVQTWEPLLYLCHTCLHQGSPEQTEGLIAIARSLLQRGANPNAEYHWNWHRELPRTALWGALCAVNSLPLAEVLLAGGANPTDGVSMHITAGSGNLAALELLHRFRADFNGVPGGVPPLPYILGFTKRADGPRWLLEHGADANLPWDELGNAPLHIAAERWDVPMVELLVQHGADIHKRRKDGRTAHTIAELHGNPAIAAWLLAQGAKDERSPLERFISACASGDRQSAQAMLQSQPGLRSQLRTEHHLMMQAPAERGDAAVLETMLVCGFDPHAKDDNGVTALHRAAMAGRPEAVSVLLKHGASVDALDGMFSASPLVWTSEGWKKNSRQPGADHLAVAALLVAAGSPRGWIPPEKAPEPEGTQEQLAELCRSAGIPDA